MVHVKSDKVRSEVTLGRAGLKSLTEAVSVTMATLIWKARKEMNTHGFIFENKSLNILYQKSTEENSFKNINLGDHFLLKTFLLTVIFHSLNFPK